MMQARECDCPASVMRCAHLGDQRIVLDKDQPGLHTVDCPWRGDVRSNKEYEVSRLIGQPRIGCACGALLWEWDAGFMEYAGDNYGAALTAFHDAEARLLRQEA